MNHLLNITYYEPFGLGHNLLICFVIESVRFNICASSQISIWSKYLLIDNLLRTDSASLIRANIEKTAIEG